MKQTPTNTCSEISIHALLAESDRGYKVPPARDTTFLSTLSLRRATREVFNAVAVSIISIHALLAESDLFRVAVPEHIIMISIHALLAESDVWPGLLARPFLLISIHALLAESDQRNLAQHPQNKLFLSTLSLRRATPGKAWQCVETPAFLSTLSLRRATWADTNYNLSDIISIHALLAESDTVSTPDIPKAQFLSTLSLRRATG